MRTWIFFKRIFDQHLPFSVTLRISLKAGFHIIDTIASIVVMATIATKTLGDRNDFDR